jgi:hypothetical protein
VDRLMELHDKYFRYVIRWTSVIFVFEKVDR